MKVYYDNRHKQWCAAKTNKQGSIAACGNTEEEAIKNFHYARNKK